MKKIVLSFYVTCMASTSSFADKLSFELQGSFNKADCTFAGIQGKYKFKQKRKESQHFFRKLPEGTIPNGQISCTLLDGRKFTLVVRKFILPGTTSTTFVFYGEDKVAQIGSSNGDLFIDRSIPNAIVWK